MELDHLSDGRTTPTEPKERELSPLTDIESEHEPILPPINTNDMVQPVFTLRESWQTLSEEAASQIRNNQTVKIFKDVKEFDDSDPGMLLDWLEDLETAFGAANVTEETAKIYLAVYKCKRDYRRQIARRPEVLGHSYKRFVEMMYEDFPEAANMDEGSMSKLKKVVQKYRQLLDWDVEKLKAYHRAFKYEIDKLMKEPAVLNNHNAVQWYLSGLSDYWRERINQVMGEITREEAKKNRGKPRREQRRFDDPWDLKVVMQEMEVLMAAGDGSVYMKMNELSLADPLLKDMYKSKPSASQVKSPGFPHTVSPSTKKKSNEAEIKEEPATVELYDRRREEEELHQMGVAASVDAHTAKLRAQDQEIQSLRTGMDSIKTLSGEVISLKKTLDDLPTRLASALQTNTRSSNPPMGNRTSNNGFNTRSNDGSACFFCKDPSHRVRDCPHQKRLMDKGLIAWNQSARTMMMKDGSRFPEPGPNQTYKDSVNEYIKAKGWDRNADSFMFQSDDDPIEEYYRELSGSNTRSFTSELDLKSFANLVIDQYVTRSADESKN